MPCRCWAPPQALGVFALSFWFYILCYVNFIFGFFSLHNVLCVSDQQGKHPGLQGGALLGGQLLREGVKEQAGPVDAGHFPRQPGDQPVGQRRVAGGVCEPRPNLVCMGRRG